MIHLRSEKSDLLAAGFWGMQVITVFLALSRLCGYLMDCLATVSHLFSIHIVCCCFKVVPSSVTLSVAFFNSRQEGFSFPGPMLDLVMQPQRGKGVLLDPLRIF